MTDGFLKRAYATTGTDATRALYDQWAASYDAEVKGLGYATPGRIARALAGVVPDRGWPVLDYGCGTGLSGLALKGAGFQTVDGADLSPAMLRIARDRGIYRTLWQVEADGTDPSAAAPYRIITAVGVIGIGAAPVTLFDALIARLRRGGLFAFSFNDPTLLDPAFEGRVNDWVDSGAARLLLREHGPHLPQAEMKATIYILEIA